MTRVTLLAISLIALLSACGSAGESAAGNSMNAEARSETVAENVVATDNDAGFAPAGAASANTAVAKSASLRDERAAAVPTKISLTKAEETYTSQRKVIRNAELNLEAENPEDAQRKITSIAELRGGFVVESQQSSSEIRSTTRDIVTMTVRVPSDKFGDALADIRNVSTRVVLETVKGQDVTEEFIDIEAQLKAKKALEAQFMEIMKRANTIGDALNVQSQLASVRGEIERIEGRKRFLENQSSLSTIKIRLQTATVYAASSVGFGDRLALSFAAGADVAASFVLGLITVVVAALPFALVIGLPAFLFFRYVWKGVARQKLERDAGLDLD
jgi:hypothetical protein